MSRLPHTTSAHVGRLIVADNQPDPLLLLGAGASVKSGIPAAGDLAAQAAKWGYCAQAGRPPGDPAVKQSDWGPWLRNQTWFDSDTSLQDQYPRIVEHALRPRDYRRDFFLEAVKLRVEPSAGYQALADLVVAGLVRTVLTPNFDDLAPRALRARFELRHVETVQSPDDLVKLSTAPNRPQVVYLHGSVEHYSDQNLIEETQAMHPKLRDELRPLLKDHPLVVVGYRGAERSIMLDLLLSGARQAGGYRHGIFWCVRTLDESDLPGPVLELASAIGSNFQLVPIRGFDECMAEWAHLAAREHRRSVPHDREPSTLVAVADLAPTEVDVDRLMLPLVREKLALYRERLAFQAAAAKPSDVGAHLIEADLATPTAAGVRATRAGELLFGRGAVTTVEVQYGSATTPVRGNVFRLVDRLLDMVDEVNEPYRLKGRESREVRPYPPLAIKELLVNALVHRDHTSREPVRLVLDRDELTITSPGGLLPDVDPARLGQPGEKAYRNPVLADVLYGCGVMDKRGSGLADAQRLSREAGGDASFGPTRDNAHFVATLRPRLEQPDSATRTATPSNVQRFVSNLVPVRIEADVLNAALCNSRYRDIDSSEDDDVPPYFLHDSRVWTFSDLADASNPLAHHIAGPIEVVALETLIDDPDRQRLVVQLLNRMLLSHARDRGLVAHRVRQRLWFPRTEEGPRQVTYQARVREATRTVTKQDKTQRKRWVHESCRFSFRRYGPDWVLHLVPGWVFTHDGYEDVLSGPGVSRLATRRSAREYNSQVAAHLHFWLWVLTNPDLDGCVDRHSNAVFLAPQLVSVEVSNAPTPLGLPDAHALLDDDESGDELEDDQYERAS